MKLKFSPLKSFILQLSFSKSFLKSFSLKSLPYLLARFSRARPFIQALSQTRSLFILLVLSLVYWATPMDKPKELSFHSASQPEEYMSNVQVWSFTETGDLKHYLSTEYWAYRPETGSSKLTAPHLIAYKPDQTVWKISALGGHVTQPDIGRVEQVELIGKVVLERPSTQKELPIKVETEVVRYKPKTQYAETDQFITLTRPDLTITGTGMRAFLDKSFVELLHNVKTSYVPNHS